MALLLAQTAMAALRAVMPSDFKPIAFVDMEGRPKGFAVDLFRRLADELGEQVTFETNGWTASGGVLRQGRADLVIAGGGLAASDLVGTIPYLTTPGVWVVPSSLEIKTVDDLRGRRICALDGSDAERYLHEHPVAGTTLVLRKGMTAVAENVVVDKSVDAALLPFAVARELVYGPFAGRLQIAPVAAIGFKKDFRYLLHMRNLKLALRLNDALSVIESSGEYARLYGRWFTSAPSSHGRTFIIGGDADFPPFEFLDNKVPAGYNVDLSKAVADVAGFNPDIRLGNWGERQDAVLDGRVDVLQGMLYTEARARRFIFSRPHYSMHYVAIARRRGPPPPERLEELTNRLVAVESDGVMEECLQWLPVSRRKTVPTLAHALSELDAGRVDCVIAPRMVALRILNECPNQRQNLVLGTGNIYAADYCFATRPGNEALLAEIDVALMQLKAGGEYRRIRDRWALLADKEVPSMGLALRRLWPFVLVGLGLVAILVAVILALRGVVRRVSAEARRQYELQQRILHCSPQVLLALDRKGRVLLWNPAAEKLFGHTCAEVVGRELPIIEKTCRSTFLHHCQATKSEKLDRMTLVRKDGRRISVRVQTMPFLDEHDKVIGLVAAVEDMTAQDQAIAEQRRLEKALRQSQRLEAVGQLAGGIAHDFNNLLQVMLGYGELLMDQQEGLPEGGARDDVGHIMDAARRSAKLVAQLLAFGRRQVLSLQVTDLNTVVTGMTELLRRAVGDKVGFLFVPGDRLELVKVDRGQVEQILMNLCVNARDAMPQGGDVVVSTRNVSSDELFAILGGSDEVGTAVKEGRYVQLSVADEGTGIPEAIRRKVFDPFFTTKPRGKGTGLGLSTVYGLVRQHGGYVFLTSGPDKGTTFKVLLPAVSANGALPTGHKTESRTAPVPHGHETILLADDSGPIRALTARVLESAGYHVLTAADGWQAIHLYDGNPDGIDALVLDVVMPRLGGHDVYAHVRMSAPGKPVLFMSGYNAEALHKDFVLEPDVVLIQKPFQPQELLRKLREVIDAARQASNQASSRSAG